MKSNPRARPSKSPLFRLTAFAMAVGLFVFSYWLGNRYKSPDLPDLQALVLSPAQPLAKFQVAQDGNSLDFNTLVHDWLLLWAGNFSQDDLTLLIRAHNRLANSAQLQQHFRIWLLEPSNLVLPDFVQVQPLTDEERERIYRLWQLEAGENLLFLINPEGRLQAIFTGIRAPATMANDFQAILDYFSR